MEQSIELGERDLHQDRPTVRPRERFPGPEQSIGIVPGRNFPAPTHFLSFFQWLTESLLPAFIEF